MRSSLIPTRSTESARWLTGLNLWAAGWVPGWVGDGFERYARIFHPLGEDADSPRWSDIARQHGRTVEATTTWSQVTGEISSGRSYPGEPLFGDLAPVALRPLCQNLAEFTATPQRCWFALWEGWGWLHPGGTGVLSAGRGFVPPEPEPAPADWQLDQTTATFTIPGRRYLLFEGSLESALEMGGWRTRSWPQPQSPSLFWPHDHAWCVATEVDADFTLVGGSNDLIAAILADTRLESVAIARDAPRLKW